MNVHSWPAGQLKLWSGNMGQVSKRVTTLSLLCKARGKYETVNLVYAQNYLETVC